MLFDFGIARVIGLDEDQDHVAGGKYAYMSPEQLDGMSKTSTKMAQVQIMLRKLIILVVLLAIAAAGLTYLGVDVPVVGPFFQNLMGQ